MTEEHSVAKQVHDARPKLGPNDATIDRDLAARLLPRRSFGAHKWGVGGLVIVAGAPGYAGAAMLSALAAGRAGAGIVNVATSRGVAGLVVGAAPETAAIPLPDPEGPMGKKAVEEFEKKLEKSAALLVGPGLGEEEDADAVMTSLFARDARKAAIGFGFGVPAARASEPAPEGDSLAARSGKPIAIDADGLNWLARQDNWPDLLPKGRCVLTPHVGEMARLLGKDSDEIVADPLKTVREAAKAWGQTVVFKYGYTAVSDGERTLVADDAPMSLATAGAGDVLAGSIGALLAQGLAPMDAAALAVWSGIVAARRLEERFGTLGVIAGDLPAAIAEVMAGLEREGGEGRD